MTKVIEIIYLCELMIVSTFVEKEIGDLMDLIDPKYVPLFLYIRDNLPIPDIPDIPGTNITENVKNELLLRLFASLTPILAQNGACADASWTYLFNTFILSKIQPKY